VQGNEVEFRRLVLDRIKIARVKASYLPVEIYPPKSSYNRTNTMTVRMLMRCVYVYRHTYVYRKSQLMHHLKMMKIMRSEASTLLRSS